MITAKPNFMKNRMGAHISIIMAIIICFYVYGAFGWAAIIYLGVVELCMYLTDTNTIITVDEDKAVLKSGILSKKTSEVMHVDVRNIQVSQTFFGRIFNLGTLSISRQGKLIWKLL